MAHFREESLAERSLILSCMRQSIGASLKIDDVFQQFTAQIAQLIAYDAVSLVLLNDDRRTCERFALIARANVNLRPGQCWPLNKTAASIVLRGGSPILAHNMAADPRFSDQIDKRWIDEGFCSVMIVPLRSQAAIVGSLAVFSYCPNTYSLSDIELLEQIADATASAIETIYRHTRSRRLAIAEERNRIAREMYDSLTQSLLGVLLQLETTERRNLNQAQLQADLHQARVILQRTLATTRRSLWSLEPNALEDQTLAQALHDELEHWQELSGIPARLFVRGEGMISLRVEASILRITQEALHNIATHAAASVVRVELEYSSDEVRVLIGDDGRGFVAPVSNVPLPGRGGLSAMYGLAEIADGQLTLSSWPNNGTRIEARFPRSASQHADQRLSLANSLNGPRPVRVLLVEPQALMRQALIELLRRFDGLLIVGDAPDGYGAIELARHSQPDLVLLEMQLPGMDGAATVEQLLVQQPGLAVIMLTACNSAESLTRAVQVGVRGYLLKDSTGEQLCATISGVMRGEVVIEQRLTRHLAERFAHLRHNRHAHDMLSERELEVLRLVVEGRRNREIAETLRVSAHTVKTHISNIFQKLGVTDRTAAVAVALQRNLGGLAIAQSGALVRETV